LVDLDDELINAYKTFATLSTFPRIAFAGGCHRFMHMEKALEPIQKYLSWCDI
jgi:hypothetical protein